LGATLFDSRVGGPNDGTSDADLLINHGNLLLLQDDARPGESAPGVFAQPVDDPDGGDLIFAFAPAAAPTSVRLTDLDPPPNHGPRPAPESWRGRAPAGRGGPPAPLCRPAWLDRRLRRGQLAHARPRHAHGPAGRRRGSRDGQPGRWFRRLDRRADRRSPD